MHDRHTIGTRIIETIVIRMSAVRLTAVGDLIDAQPLQYRSAAAYMIA